MKFLLVAINSKFIHSNPAVYSLKSYAEQCLRAQAEQSDTEIKIVEYTINQRFEDILSDIYGMRPDYVGFSCYVWNFDVVKKLLNELVKLLPDTGVFLGGPEVSFHPEKVMVEFPYLEGIMIGEGEATFAEVVSVCTNIEGKKADFSSIKGLYLKNGYTPKREPLLMDAVPFFYADEKRSRLSECFEDRILYYESSRGCPYRCSYCLSSIDKGLRLRSLEEVFEHLDFFLNNRVKQVKFIDRTFNANHEHAISIWKYILKNDNGVTNFHFEIAADIMTEEEADIISRMRPGLVQLEIGVQSTNEKTLREINRYSDPKHIRKIVEKLNKSHNVHIHLDLIAGLPYEDYESFKNSFNEVFNMHPNQLQLGFLKVLKGTLMEEHADEYGLRFLDMPPYEVLCSRWISYEELRRLKDVERVLEDYYNSAQFTQTLPELLKLFDTPFDFFDALAVFYQKNGYFVKTPARSRRYEILLEFVTAGGLMSANSGTAQGCEKALDEYVEMIRSRLTLDYYLRENPKSRPDFVKEVPDLRSFDYSRRDPLTYNASYEKTGEA